jgi:uncharacterized protein (TIGR04255 family)
MNALQLIHGDPPPRRHYRKNFLREVIARADFDAPLPIEKGPHPDFRKAVKHRYPISEPRQVVARELLIGPESSKERKVQSVEWRYFNADRDGHASLGPQHLVVSTANYSRFEPFAENFLALLPAALSQQPDRQIIRLGMRYINHVKIDEPEPTSWGKYLIEPLYSIFSLADDASRTSRAFQVLEFNYGSAYMRFQFGMHNPDHPAPIRRKVYVLDYDVYTDTTVERHEVADHLRAFHDKVNASFEQVITDELRKKMGQKNP